MKVKAYPFVACVLALALLSMAAQPALGAADAYGEAGLAAEQHNCRFWGIISENAPAAAIQDHLVNLPNSIEALSPANPDGWSVGYYPDGNSDPTVNRGFPPAYTDLNFDAAVDEAALATPRIAVSHVRNTSTGVTPASGDPHPFERVKDGRHWLMGHNGTIDKNVLLDLIRPDYFAANPPQYGSNQSEWIDSDLYQILVLQTLEDFNFQVKPALGYVIRRLREEIDSGTSPSTEQLNFFLTDGTTLWAYREGNTTHTLYYLYDTTGTPYSAVASQYPSSSQGSWVEMDNGDLITMQQDGPPVVEDIENYFGGALLVDNSFDDSADSTALRADGAGQDWYESRELEQELLTLDETLVGGNGSKKAAFEASATGNAYVSQEFGTPQAGVFSVQWDIYVDEIIDIGDPDRAGWMLIGDGTDSTRTGPNSDDSERFVYMSFFRDGGGTTGTADLVARDRDDGWTAFTTVASGLNLDQWYTIKVVCDIPAGTYDVYVDDVFQSTVSSRHEKASVTHISFAQWDDGAGAFYVDNVYRVTDGTGHTLTMAVDPPGGGTTDPTVGAHTYPEDTTVTITAYANAGYEFDHWTGDVADSGSASTTVTMDGDKTVTAHFSSVPIVFLADNDLNASADSADLRANGAGQDWYESRELEEELLTLDETLVGGNVSKKAAFEASATGNAYVSQEFGTPQAGVFSVQWDIYVDEILDIGDPDRAGWMLIGDGTDSTRTGPNSDDSERFVYMSFFRDGGGDTGTMDLVARDRDDGWTAFTTVASGLNLDQWYTIRVICDVPAGTYDVYVDDVFQGTVSSRHEKASVTHISFAQWDDGAGAFYVDNVYEVTGLTHTLTMAVDPAEGGTTDPTVGAHVYPEDATVTVSATPNAGYEFDYWEGDVADPNAASTTVVMDGDKTVTAHFAPLPAGYTLTMVASPAGGGTTDPSVGAHFYAEDEVVTISAVANAGYEFDGWTGDVADPNAATTTVVMDEDQTVTARFAPTGVPTCVTIQRGAFGEVADGFIWEDRPTEGNFTMYDLRTGLWRTGETRTLIRFDLDALPEDAAVQSATLGLNQQSPGTGETVHIHRITEAWSEGGPTWDSFGDNYDAFTWASFVSVGGDLATDVTDLVAAWVADLQPNYGMMLINSPTSAVDRYISSDYSRIDMRPWLEVCYVEAANYTLTMVADPTAGGTTDPAPGDHIYAEGTAVDVTAVPNAGYEFDHWTGDVADPDSASTTVTMDGDKAVTAHFSLVPVTYELTMAVDPTEGGTTDPTVGAHTYPESEVVAITATPNAGYEFDNWTGDVADPDSASTTVTMDGDKTVTAHFSPLVAPLLVDTDFDASVDSADLRADSPEQDWYESRADVPELLMLDTEIIGGNGSNKAKLDSYGVADNAYLTQDFGEAQSGVFAVSMDVYVDQIEDSGTYDRAGHIYIGYEDAGGTNGPNSTSNERFVFMAFYDSTPGTSGDDIVLKARTSSAQGYGTTSLWTDVATGLSYDTWHTIKIECDVAGGTYDVYVDGLLAGDDISSYSGYASSSVTHISFVADSDGRGTFYVDDVYEDSIGTTHTLTMAADPTEGGTTDPTAGLYTCIEDATVTITAIPNAGYQFDGWTGGVADPNSASTTVTMGEDQNVTANFSPIPTVFLADNDFDASADDDDLRDNGTDQDWYESRGDDPTLLFLDETTVGGNGTKKAGFTASTSGNAYLSQEFGTPQDGTFSARWDIYVENILDSEDRDRAALMLIGDDSGGTNGPNSTSSERFVFMAFYCEDGCETGTADLIARETGDGYDYSTQWRTVATGISLDEWHTIQVGCDLGTDAYDVYVDGALVYSGVDAYASKASLTHISFAQWNDGAGAFYVDNVYETSGIAHTLTMAASPTAGGTTEPTPGEHTYVEGTTVAITAIPNAGYQFDNWTGDVADPDAASTTVLMDEGQTVTANFSLVPTTYELTMAVDPTAGGTTDPAVGAHTYPEDEVVSITATPNAGYEFDHWSGDVADPDSASTTVTMDGNKTVTAHFSLIPTTYELTMAVDPTAGGTTDPSVGAHTYPEDEIVSITATPNAGYEFDHWTGDVADPNSASTTVVMDEDQTVTAHFAPTGVPTCVTVQRGAFGEVDDGFIWEGRPTEGNFTMYDFRTGLWRSDETRTLIRFDLGFLPAGAVVQSATMGLQQQAPGTGETVHVYRITEAWSEGGPTWDSFAGNYDAFTWASFVSVGGDLAIDVTDLVTAWADGTESNYGMMLINSDTTAVDRYISSDYSRIDMRPWLEVCYMAP